MRGRLGGIVASLAVVVSAALSGSTHGSPAYDAQSLPGVRCSSTYPQGLSNPRLDPLRLPFDLDQGRLVVSQPDRGHQLTVSADTARTEFLSTAEVAGPHSCLAFGLAEVATRPDTVEPGPPPRLAWVGLASAAIIACPVITDDSDEDHPEPVRVVIIDAGDPTSVSVYTSRGSHCGAPAVGPTLAPAHQVVSVPFQLVNLEVIAYDMPSCGQRFEDGDYSGSPGTGTLIAWVHVAVPFDRGSCSSRHVIESWSVVNDVAFTAVHAPPGPVAVVKQ